MKKPFLITIQTFLLSITWCFGQIKVVANHPIVRGKSQCTLLIDKASGINFSEPIDISKTGAIKFTKGIEVNALIINNSDDTLKYVYCNRLNKLFVKTNNAEQLIVTDEPNYQFENPQLIVIPPHRYESIHFKLTYVRPPKKDFKFKIGLHLLKWINSYKTTPPDATAIEHAGVIWSEEELMKVDSDSELMITTPEGQLKRAQIVYDTLNAADYKNFTLKAQGNSVKPQKRIYRNEEYCRSSGKIYFDIPVRLTNFTKDTLKYCNMVKNRLMDYHLHNN